MSGEPTVELSDDGLHARLVWDGPDGLHVVTMERAPRAGRFTRAELDAELVALQARRPATPGTRWTARQVGRRYQVATLAGAHTSWVPLVRVRDGFLLLAFGPYKAAVRRRAPQP